MIKRYRINHQQTFDGKINTFDINLEETKIQEFSNMLSGIVNVWENVISDQGNFEKEISSNRVNKIIIIYKEGRIQVKSYKGEIYFKKEKIKDVSKFILENTGNLINNDKPIKIIFETNEIKNLRE